MFIFLPKFLNMHRREMFTSVLTKIKKIVVPPTHVLKHAELETQLFYTFDAQTHCYNFM